MNLSEQNNLANTYGGLEAGNESLINRLIEENLGWATAIAKTVARAWNMDWQLDGLDGGAFEALLFCARRYDPSRQVPFRAYARRRIHEAATEEARKAKSWQQNLGDQHEQTDLDAREISAKLFEIFPELRDGMLPGNSDGSEEQFSKDSMRSSVRQLLAGASMIAASQQSSKDNPEVIIEYRHLLEIVANLDPVHQEIVWAIYWQGQSMRSLAEEWGLDDLAIIREHKEILEYLSMQMSEGRSGKNKPLKVRRGLKIKSTNLKDSNELGPFQLFTKG